MKTTNKSLIAGMLSAALLLTVGQGWADDQIAASPKVRQMLNERKVSTPNPGKDFAMPCLKCKDAWAAQRSSDSKGSQALVSKKQVSNRVATHLCKDCSTNWQVKGEGKNKQAIAKHECNGCDVKTSACCDRKGT